MTDVKSLPTFGAWVKQKRESLEISTQLLGELSGVDPSSISRIQLERTQATLATAIRLCKTLKTSPQELLTTLTGKPTQDIVVPVSEPSSYEWTLNAHEVSTFVKLFRSENKQELSQSENKRARKLLERLIHDIGLANRRDALSKPLDLSVFYKDGSFRYDVDRNIEQIDLPYPKQINENLLFDIYAHGGAIILKDASAYLRARRQSFAMPLATLQQSLPLSDSALSRWETGSIGRLNLQDILEIDLRIAHHGEIFGMFWRASEWQMAYSVSADAANTSPESDNFRIVELLVTMYRWAILLDFGDQWLSIFRQFLDKSEASE